MRFALAGNPNSGKTTLFNQLTGSSARVGNWPGVTVDRKDGFYLYKEDGKKEQISIIDLPGIYSLSPYTPEEVIAGSYVTESEPDLIINIVDATNLERNLYLTTQLLETDRPVIIALNMMDVLEKANVTVNVKKMEEVLGVPVIPISAISGKNINALMKASYKAAAGKRISPSVLSKSSFGKQYTQIVNLLKDNGIPSASFYATKILEDDKKFSVRIPEDILYEAGKIKNTIVIDEVLDNDFEAAVADARYRYLELYINDFIKNFDSETSFSLSTKIDKLLTHRVLGIPIFLLFMFVIFHVTFSEDFLWIEGQASPGVWLQGLTEEAIAIAGESLSGFLGNQGASDWAQGLLVDGILAGVGAVLSFLPQILLLFLFLSIMEETGYMARGAFLMDMFLKKFGLSGKAFMPLLMGFGCSVPAMMGTRTLENEEERRLAIMLMPFFSCGAKLPIWALFSAAIFPKNADLVVFGIYVGGIVVAAITAIILNKTILNVKASAFLMELPPYHMPNIANLLHLLWEKLRGFVIRASTIIAASTIIIWFLSNFDFSLNMVDTGSEESILGVLGNVIVPLFAPLGFASGEGAWKAVVAIITGLIAKEMVISTLGILYNPGVEGDAIEDQEAEDALSDSLGMYFDPLTAISYMFFNLLSVPCMAAVATAHAEFKNTKWTLITVAFWLITAWVVSFLIYNVGQFLGF